MTTTMYATRVTDGFAARVAAWQAGSGVRANLVAGMLVVGDGSGAVPALSDMIAAGGVTHEVWRGQTVTAVTIDAAEPRQIDIECVVPAAIAGAEIGPFWVREFAIYDEAGALAVVGTTNLQKTTSAQGQISDLAWIASVVLATADAVVVSPPGAGYATMTQVREAINTHHVEASAPLTQTDTTDAAGWIRRIIGARAATQTLTGYGRAATDAEFAAGAANAQAAYKLPWPTLAQVRAAIEQLAAAISNITIPGVTAPLTYAGGKYGVAAATTANAGVVRLATTAEVAAGSGDGVLTASAAHPTPEWCGVGFVGAVVQFGQLSLGNELTPGSTIAGASIGLVTGWGGDGLPVHGAALSGNWRIESAAAVIIVAGAEQTGNIFYRSYIARRVA